MNIQDEIKAFERMLPQLENEYRGRWVLIYGGKLIEAFDDFDSAADDAVRRFGRGPFLIREIGGQPDVLPVSVVFAWPNARG